MAFEVAHVGSKVKVDGKIGEIITGSANHLVDGGGGGGGSSGSGQSAGSDFGEYLGMETEDMSDAERRAFIEDRYGAGTADSILRPFEGDEDGAGEEVAGSNAANTTVGCEGITNATPDSFVLSRGWTVGSLSSQAALPHRIPQTAAVGLKRHQIICNLKFLATNTLTPLSSWLARAFPGYTVRCGSGFRNDSGGSDHNRGQAADLYLYVNGQRATRAQLMTVARAFVNANIPFTQVLLEYNPRSRGWLHVANRRAGNSGLRIGYTLTASRGNFSRGLPTRV